MSDAPIPAASTRRRALWIVLGVIAIIIASLVGIGVSVWTDAEKTVDRERTRVRERLETLRAERVLRPRFFDPPEEGNSWEEISKAVAGFQSLSAAEKRCFPSIKDEDDGEGETASPEATLARLRPHFDELKRALRRSWVEPGHKYEKLFNMDSPVLAGCHRASEVLGDSARIHYRAGRSPEAVESLALLLGFADRLSVKGPLTNAWMRAICISSAAEPLRDMLGDCDMTGADLDELQRVFHVAESSRPPLKVNIQVDDILMRLTLLAVVDSGKSGSLRDWFSPNVMIARALSVQDRYELELQRSVLLHEPQRSAAFMQASRITEGTIDDRWFYDLTSAQADLQSASALHLAQVAIALSRFRVAQGRFPESLVELTPAFLNTIPHDDRTGNPFGYVHKAGVASVYSFGHDLDDDGGRPIPENAPEGDGDVVWVVKRREAAAK